MRNEGPDTLQKYDYNILEMLGCINEDLDMDKIEEKFVGLVSEVFSFDRVALLYVKHKKEVLQGKLSKGFAPEVINNLEIPLRGNSVLIKPLITGIPTLNSLSGADEYTAALHLSNFAIIPIISRKRVACWDVKNCKAFDCPAYGAKWVRCWMVAGTKCSNGSDIGLEGKAALCAECPIFADRNLDAIEGVMIVDNSISNRPITDEIIAVLSIVAHSVGAAINNSKIYMKTLDVAIRDDLTGLHNRRYFNERLLDEVERVRRYGGALGLIMCDIDHFKKINDTYGHPVGDRVLCRIAELLGMTLRKSDVIARYGGEEYAALLPNTDKSLSLTIAEKLRHSIETDVFRHGNADIKTTLSFGVAAFGVDSNSFEGLISAADKALYRAKAQGRNRVFSY